MSDRYLSMIAGLVGGAAVAAALMIAWRKAVWWA